MTDPPDLPSGGGNFWTRRSRRGKVFIVLGALLLAFIAIGAFSDPPQDEPTQEAATTTQAATTAEPAEEAEPEPEPEKAPAPVVIQGAGTQVETINLSKDSPAIATATHRGSSNFAVELVGADGSSELLVNEIGNFSGRVAVADAAGQQYRVKVSADGPWKITFTQPVPTAKAPVMPGVLSGRGADVVKFRTDQDLQLVVEGTHRGQSNFAVYIIGYGDTSGKELVFNEIGNYSGETLINNLPEGPYLLAVSADGPWTIRFSP